MSSPSPWRAWRESGGQRTSCLCGGIALCIGRDEARRLYPLLETPPDVDSIPAMARMRLAGVCWADYPGHRCALVAASMPQAMAYHGGV